MISLLFSVVRCVLWPHSWDSLEDVSCAPEEKCVLRCRVESSVVKSEVSVYSVSFVPPVSLLILSMVILSILENGVLKSPTLII